MSYITSHLQIITLILILFLSLIAFVFLTRKTECELQKKRNHSLLLLRQTKNLMRAMQTHRGISYRVLNSDNSKRSELKQLEQQITESADNLKELQDMPGIADYWQAFQDHWQRLHISNLNISADNNLQQHNKLISVLIAIAEDLMTGGHWLDNDQQQYQKPVQLLLVLLNSAEWVGQARALGAGILASGTCSSVERIRMSFLKNKLQQQQPLLPEHLHHPLQEMMMTIEEKLLTTQQSVADKDEYFIIATRIIDILMENFEQTMDAIKPDNSPTKAHNDNYSPIVV